jgi:hypothetical protein
MVELLGCPNCHHGREQSINRYELFPLAFLHLIAYTINHVLRMGRKQAQHQP